MKLNKYVAFGRDRSTGEVKKFEMEYTSKKAFKSDISGNGYDLMGGFIYTEEQWEAYDRGEEWIVDMVEDRRWKKRTRNKIKARIKRENKKLGIF